MKKKKVVVLPEAEDDISDIKHDIKSISKSSHIARKNIDDLKTELKNLSIYGSSLAFCIEKKITDRYGIHIRRANTANKKIAILYYVEPDYIIVKRVVWASSI